MLGTKQRMTLKSLKTLYSTQEKVQDSQLHQSKEVFYHISGLKTILPIAIILMA